MTVTAPPARPDGGDLAALRARYLEAQLAGDRRRALALLSEAIDRGTVVAAVQSAVIEEAQREIGRLWQENRISIAQEHMATAISQLALAHLFQFAAASAPNGKRVVVACVEGELHEFPARLAADALDLAGFDVRYLGANVPTSSLVAMLREDRPDLVALSVTMTFNVAALREAVARLRAEVGPDLRIAIGGHACGWATDLARELGAVASGCSAGDLVAGARAALGLGDR